MLRLLSLLPAIALFVVPAAARTFAPYTSDQLRVVERRADGLVLECDAATLPWPELRELTAIVALPAGTTPEPLPLEAKSDTAPQAASAALEPASRERLRGLVRLEPLDIVRDLQLARLVVSPTQPAVWGEQPVCYYHSVRFLLPYPRAAAPAAPPPPRDSDFHELFEAFVLNAFDRPLLRVGAESPPPADMLLPPQPQPARPGRKLLTDRPGLYGVPVRELQPDIGLDADPARLRVATATEAVPCMVARPAAGGAWSRVTAPPLQEDDRVVWLAAESTSPFSRAVAHWLSLADAPAASMPLEPLPAGPSSPTPVRVHIEHDRLFIQPAGEADHRQAAWWMWAALPAPDAGETWERHNGETPTSMEVAFQLPGLAGETTDVALALRLLDGQGRPRASLSDLVWTLNGSPLPTDALLRDASAEVWRLVVAAPADGTFTLTAAHAAAPGQALYLDWIDADYLSRVGAAAAQTPFRPAPGHDVAIHDATSGTLLVTRGADEVPRAWLPAPDGDVSLLPATARTRELWTATPDTLLAPRVPPTSRDNWEAVAAAGADHLIITHPLFADAVAPLAEHYRARGKRAAVLTTETVYDRFGCGTTDPHAIRACLRYALDHWPAPAPTHVLLVGDASWDYWGRFDPPVETYLPSYRLASEGGPRHFYPSDNWFGCLRGDGPLADVHIGRLPVQSATDAAVVVRKLLAYHRNEEPGPWQSRFLFLTDDGFEDYADIVIEQKLGAFIEFEELRFQDYPFIDNVYLPDGYVEEEWERRRELVKASPELTDELLARLSEGMLLVEYFGHGSPNVLGHERVLFGGGSRFSDVPRLTNGARLPFFLAWTCETGYFDFAEEKWNISIGEDLLTHPGGGAALLYVASGRGYSDHHLFLASGIHEGLFHRRLRNVGDLVLASKLVCAALSPYREPIAMFLLLGDPGATLPLPRRPLECAVTPAVINGDTGGELEIRVPRLFIAPLRGDVHVVAEDQRGKPLYRRTFTQRPLDEPLILRVSVSPRAAAAGPGRVVVYAQATETGGELRQIFAGGAFEVAYHDPPAPPDALPLLAFDDNGLDIVNQAVLYDGMTLLCDATVINSGSATARDVYVLLEPVERGPQPAGRTRRIDRIAAGDARTVRLRYDSYALAATHEFVVRIDPHHRLALATREGLERRVEVYYRSKPDLDLSPDDLTRANSDDGVLLYVRLRNIGETPARGIYYHTIGDTAISLGVSYQLADDLEWRVVAPSPAVRAVVEAGGVHEPDQPIPLPAAARRVRVTLDDAGYVDERRRDNNTVEIDLQSLHNRRR